MMSKFIELHFLIEGKVSFDVENIICFFSKDNNTIIRAKDGNCYAITESYDEVKTLIQDAGILIHKADPRLNLIKPLTLDDLKNMEGEPVWNSNTLKWELVWYYGDAKEVIFTRDCGADYEYNADDLIKTPLYRMRQ